MPLGTPVSVIRAAAVVDSLAGSQTDRAPSVASVSTALSAKLAAALVSNFVLTLLDDTDAPSFRTTLGLGSMATQAASAVAITGGTITGITDLAIVDGGTGASTAAGARSNLSVYSIAEVDTALSSKADLVGGVIPTSQIPSIALSEFLGTVSSQSAMLALTGDRGDWCYRSDTASFWILTADDQSLIGSWQELAHPTANVSSINGQTGTVTLGYADVGAAASDHNHSGVYQPLDGELTAIAGLTSAADKGVYFTGSGTAGLFDISTFTRTYTGAANAGAFRTAVGLAIGSDVQAFDAELAAIAGLTSAANKGIYFTGAGTAATFDLSSFARTFLDDADAATVRSTLGAAASTDAPAIVCVSPTSNSTWNGNSGTYTSATDLTVTPSGTGKWSAELLILTKLTTTAVSTAFRVLLGDGAAIANADADPVGAALAQGASGFANMTYTSSTGIISGQSKSSGDNYVIFWVRYEVDVTTVGTFTPQLSIAGSTSGVLSLKAGSYHKWTKL